MFNILKDELNHSDHICLLSQWLTNLNYNILRFDTSPKDDRNAQPTDGTKQRQTLTTLRQGLQLYLNLCLSTQILLQEYTLIL